MRTTRTLAIASALGLGMSFAASANVVYDSETTNAWFDAQIATSSTLSGRWTQPTNGEAVVKGESNPHYIELDTDLDDPLSYTPLETSADVAVVAAEMTATVNTTEPEIDNVPQAALTVIGNGAATNWVGLVGDGSGTSWVTFPSPVPVAGEPYSVRIEFDQRPEARQIRYLVDGTVLGKGWYPNPQAGSAKISKVSFSGSGDIKALVGENIAENTITFNTPTETEGFDFTNGTISVSANIQGYTGVTAELKLVNFATGAERTIGEAQPLTGGASWDLSSLTAGGTYGYTIEAKVGDTVIGTKTGTFTAAKWPTGIWFGADASKSEDPRVKGGSWVKAPTIDNNTYVIDDGAVFTVTDQKPGSNHVTRVDTKVTFETLVDSTSLEAEDGAIGGFVAAKSGDEPQWMALTADNVNPWIALTGDIAPAVDRSYVVRAEVDFISATKRVRFLVSDDDGVTFAPLSNGASQWINLATQEKYSLAAVELKGSGKVDKFEATVANKALAVVEGVEYDTMAEAFEAAGTNGEHVITLKTNATVDPKEPGTYDIAPGDNQYASGGQILTEKKAIVIDESGKIVVRPSTDEMEAIKTPDKATYKNINSLRAFLERNKVEAYTTDKGVDAITSALNEVPEDKNGLELWQDYVMGIEPADSVAPVTIPTGDTDPDAITLAIPAIDPSKYSGDYTIGYKVGDGSSQSDPQAIRVPLTTGTYTIKATFTPATAQ